MNFDFKLPNSKSYKFNNIDIDKDVTVEQYHHGLGKVYYYDVFVCVAKQYCSKTNMDTNIIFKNAKMSDIVGVIAFISKCNDYIYNYVEKLNEPEEKFDKYVNDIVNILIKISFINLIHHIICPSEDSNVLISKTIIDKICKTFVDTLKSKNNSDPHMYEMIGQVYSTINSISERVSSDIPVMYGPPE